MRGHTSGLVRNQLPIRLTPGGHALGLSATPSAATQWRLPIRSWLKRMATAALPNRLAELAQAQGFRHGPVSVGLARGRWGSCNRHGGIRLSARLLFLQPAEVDYVLLHELTHTEVFNHSPQFWARLETALPGAMALDRRLRSATGRVPIWLD